MSKAKNTHDVGFKERIVDFVVEEKIPYKLKPRGTWLYVKIEKRNMNTADMVRDVAKLLGLKPKQIGVAGLKDKYAIAIQWLCIGVRDLGKTSTKTAIIEIESIVKVLDHGFHEKPLNLSSEIKNHFAIRLRYDQIISETKKFQISTKINKIATEGFPNYFGEQRFGATGNNHRVGQEILEGKHKNITDNEKKIKLQAYGSWLFNQYLEFRTNINHMYLIEGDIVTSKEGLVVWDGKNFQKIKDRKKEGFLVDAEYDGIIPHLKIDGDVRTHITGAFIGYNTILSPEESKARELETHWLDHFEIDEESMLEYKKISLYGLRRHLWVIPEGLKHSWQGNDILIQFTLPKSSYASTLIDTIFDYKTPQRGGGNIDEEDEMDTRKKKRKDKKKKKKSYEKSAERQAYIQKNPEQEYIKPTSKKNVGKRRVPTKIREQALEQRNELSTSTVSGKRDKNGKKNRLRNNKNKRAEKKQANKVIDKNLGKRRIAKSTHEEVKIIEKPIVSEKETVTEKKKTSNKVAEKKVNATVKAVKTDKKATEKKSKIEKIETTVKKKDTAVKPVKVKKSAVDDIEKPVKVKKVSSKK